ncbi:MAG: hypothetical protein HY053_00560 [Proteobacteria bacterium]|nr:hypothetical protein [Pseudomonadota bacterium]
MAMYFDPGCGFCEKTARLFRELCLSPFSQVLPASVEPEMLALLKQHHSWIVKDGNRGKIYMKWEAVSFVLRQNPFTWIFGTVTDLPFLKGLMRGVYEWIGRSRPALGKLTSRLLPFTDKHPRAWPLMEVLCAMMIMITFLGNVVSLPPFEKHSPVYTFIKKLVTYTLVYQKWDLFAPMTTHWTYGYEAEGLTTSGQKADITALFENKRIWKLDSYHLGFINHYWQKYYQRLYEKNYRPSIRQTLQQMCERYNQEHPEDRLVMATLRLLRNNYVSVVPDTPLQVYSSETVECGIR